VPWSQYEFERYIGVNRIALSAIPPTKPFSHQIPLAPQNVGLFVGLLEIEFIFHILKQ
jgi:hypothetical protein